MFQLPQSREEFMLFVQQVAREDVKKCLAGVSSTHPELVQQFVPKVQQQTSTTTHHHTPFLPSSIENQIPNFNQAPPSSISSPPTKISSYSTALVGNNQNPPSQQPQASHSVHTSPTKNIHHVNNHTKPTSVQKSPNSKNPSSQPTTPIKSERKITEKVSSPNNKVKKSPDIKISERLLKPTISMQKKFEKDQVKKKSNEKEFKELRKEQKKSTSLLLKKKPTKKEVKKPVISPKPNNESKTESNETNTTNEIQDHSEDESNIEPSQYDESHQEIIENELDISEISSTNSVASYPSQPHSTPTKSQPSSAQSSPKNQPSPVTPSPPPKISPKKEISQPIIINLENSAQSEKPKPPSPKRDNSLSDQPSISSISNHSNNPQYEKLEEMVLDDLLRELVREDHFANKKRAEQEIKIIEKKSQQNDKYDEILKLLTQLEQDEQSIRKRFASKNYSLNSTIESETSSETSQEGLDNYDGLGIETVKVVQKFKRRNKKYFDAFCRPHDLSIETLMQVVGEDILKEVIADVCDEFSDAMSDIVKNTAAHEFGMNDSTSDTSSFHRTTDDLSSTLKSTL